MRKKNNFKNKKLLFIFPQGIGDFLHALDNIILNSINLNKNQHTFLFQYKQQSDILNYLYKKKKNIFLTTKIRQNKFLIVKLIIHLLINKFDNIIVDPNISFNKIKYLKYIYGKKLIIINKKLNENYTKIDAYKDINKIINKSEKNYSFNDFINNHKTNNHLNIGFSVGSGSLEKNKRWPINYFCELIKLILTNNKFININLYGSASELHLNEQIFNTLSKYYPNRIRIINTANINEIFEIFKNLKLFISNDNGLSHFASLLKVKTFVLYGPTPTYSNGKSNYRIPISIGYKCSPCYDNFRFGCGETKCFEYLNPKIVYNILSNDIRKII